MIITPSKEQQVVYDVVRNSSNHVCIQATAGSGKTHTLLEILKFLPRTKKIVFLSFSNTIVNELKEKVPPHIMASTLHSLGCRMSLRGLGGGRNRIKVDQSKYFKKVISLFDKEKLSGDTRAESFKMIYEVVDIINYMRMTLCSDQDEDIFAMCDYYGISVTVDHLKLVKQVDFRNETKIYSIDFTDMIYLPAVKPYLIDVQYDFVLLDEAQDLNNAQRLFIERLLGKTGRLIACGDKFQSIYSFAGSTIDSFEILQNKSNTQTLPLSTTYRCGKNIVKKAQSVFGPDIIQPFKNNQDGQVRDGSIEEVQIGDIVLCRFTAPLIRAFFFFLSKGIKASVLGKDYEKGLLSLVRKIQSTTKEGMLYNLQLMFDKLKEELTERGIKAYTKHQSWVDLEEKKDVIHILFQNIEDAEQLPNVIEKIFTEDGEAIRLMTVHRSKGLENDTVFIIERYDGKKLLPSDKAASDWQKIQEKNLQFVAYTRAKHSLIFLSLFSEGAIESPLQTITLTQDQEIFDEQN